MRAIVQRVSRAEVFIENNLEAKIGNGLLILLGIESADTIEDIEWLVNKLAAMRIFDDSDGKMNLSIQDIRGEFLVVSQFTLHASTKKGNRPSFIRAARPEVAIPLYEEFKAKLADHSGLPVLCGVFGAEMSVGLTNSGPVTIYMDSKSRE